MIAQHENAPKIIKTRADKLVQKSRLMFQTDVDEHIQTIRELRNIEQ